MKSIGLMTLEDHHLIIKEGTIAHLTNMDIMVLLHITMVLLTTIHKIDIIMEVPLTEAPLHTKMDNTMEDLTMDLLLTKGLTIMVVLKEVDLLIMVTTALPHITTEVVLPLIEEVIKEANEEVTQEDSRTAREMKKDECLLSFNRTKNEN
jgi:hypothetical protein